MKNLLVAVIVSLLGAVHSTPVFPATLTNAENDDLQEAMIDELLIPSVTTPAPKSYPSIQASQHPSSDNKNSHVIESSGYILAGDEELGSGNSEGKSGRGMILFQDPDTISSSTSSPINEAASSSSTVQPVNDGEEESGSGNSEGKSGRGIILFQDPDTISSSTSSPINEAASSSSTVQPVNDGEEESGSGNSEGKSGRGMILFQDPDTISSSTSSPINEAASSSSTVQPVNDGVVESGSGNIGDKLESTTAAKTTTYTTSESSSTQSSRGKTGRGMKPGHDPATISNTIGSGVIEDKVSVRTEKGLQQSNGADVEVPRKEGSRTPGWMVVLACIVGVAVLVIVCVAVTTRERWHGPSRALQPDIKTGPEREREIETFLHNDKPKEIDSENGYTVVPLDELPQSYTSR